MFQNIFGWLFNRALRLSHKATVRLAKRTHQTPEAIAALNDAGAMLVIGQVQKAVPKSYAGQ